MRKRSTDSRKTLVKINISAKHHRFYKEIIQVGIILLSLAAFFLLFATVQVYMCWDEHPNRTIKECLVTKKLGRK